MKGETGRHEGSGSHTEDHLFTTTLQHSTMAAVVPFASCYASGKGPRGGNYLSLLTYRGPRCTPRPHLSYHAPKMTLRQICRMLKMMKQIRNRETAAAAAAAARKQGSASQTPPSPGTKSEKRCIPSCLRRKRCIKRVS